MKKINSNGFVLAETLVVAVFLMAIFTLIFTNFYPLIGEYEKRETYDNVEGKYNVYWIRRMIEDSSYQPTANSNTDSFFKNKGFIRFECKDVKDSEKNNMCKSLVKALEVSNCDSNGNNCEIYITKYQIGSTTKAFKDAVDTNYHHYEINNNDRATFIAKCLELNPGKNDECGDEADRKEFRSGFKDYIESLPDYKVEAYDNSKYRVIVSFHNKKDNNNYYSYATMEVDR